LRRYFPVTIVVVIGLGGNVSLHDIWDFIRVSVFMGLGTSAFALAVIALIVLLHLSVGGPRVPVRSLGAFLEWWERTGRLQFALGVITSLIVGWFHYYRRMLVGEVLTACVGALVIILINRRNIGA